MTGDCVVYGPSTFAVVAFRTDIVCSYSMLNHDARATWIESMLSTFGVLAFGVDNVYSCPMQNHDASLGHSDVVREEAECCDCG